MTDHRKEANNSKENIDNKAFKSIKSAKNQISRKQA